MAFISELLENCSNQGQWANRGPLYQRLRDLCRDHAGLSEALDIVPVANGGVALEALAALQSRRAGRPLRWLASAYTFQNLGRGRFHDVLFVDCDAQGLLNMSQLMSIDPASYDGIIVTNPFGLHLDFSAYSEFARRMGKRLLMDNASGFHSRIPDVPWQAISLHHTKPYGMGEGGLAIVPRDQAEALYDLISYGLDLEGAAYWVGNGKLSDISAAFLIDRIRRAPDWAVRGLQQRERVMQIARRCGLTPLAEPASDIPMTSLPFLAPEELPHDRVRQSRHVIMEKYYVPQMRLPQADRIYRHVLNIPCHADMEQLSDADLEDDILQVVFDVKEKAFPKIVAQ